MKLDNYRHLVELSKQSNQSRLLFTFEFYKLQFKCLFFYWSSTFLISNSNGQVAYMFALNDSGDFNGKLPNEFYLSIYKELTDSTGSNKVTQLWEALSHHILTLTIKDIEPITHTDIAKFVRQTSTKDKDYDSEGAMPFFKNWRRNNERQKVSLDNLNKTERLFGREVRQRCFGENVSSVWSSVYSEKSDDFLKKEISFN